jgi:hypothetical protein
MGPRRIPCILVAVCLFAGGALGQQAPPAGSNPPMSPPTSTATMPPLPWTPPPTVRDPQAIAVVQTSINAMGGAAAIAQVQNLVVNMQADESSAGGAAGPLVLTVSGTEFRSDFQGPNGVVTLSTGNGTPYRTNQGATKKVSQWVTRAQFSPVLIASILTNEFQNPNYSFQFKGNSTLGSNSVVVIATVSQASKVDSQVTPQTWYFDSSTGLPVRVEYRLPDNGRSKFFLTGAADISGYQSVAGVLYPFQASLSVGTKSLGTRTVTSVQPNTGVSATQFAAPAGGIQ